METNGRHKFGILTVFLQILFDQTVTMTSHDYKLLVDDDVDKSTAEKAKNAAENPPGADDKELFDEYILLHQHQKKKEETKKEFEARCFSYAKFYSTLIGLIIGCLIQGSNLGMEMLIVMKETENALFYYPTVYVSQKTYNLIQVWSIVISIAGASILFLMRALIESSLLGTASVRIGKSWEEEGFIFKFLMLVDCFFSIGVIFAVTCSWYLYAAYFGHSKLAKVEGLDVATFCVLWYGFAVATYTAAVAQRKKYLAKKQQRDIASESAKTKKEEAKLVVQIV